MIGVGAVSLTALATGSSALFLAVVPIAYTIGWGWPGLFNLAVVRTSPGAPGAATGITQTGAYAGAVLGPPLFGLLAEHRSYASAWTMAGAWLLLGAVTIVAGSRALRSTPSPRPPG
jgi:predicted MFS family arabinose efflux permease